MLPKMDNKEVLLLKKALERQKKARIQAEKILEEKSKELYDVTSHLKETNERLENLLSEKTSELDGVFINIVDPYIVMDLQFNILKMNTSAKEFLGYDSDNEKVNLQGLVHKDFIEYTANSIKSLLEVGVLKNYRAKIIIKDGTEKFIQINGSLIRDKEGKAIAAQGIVRDITQETEIKVLLAEQKEELEISNKGLQEYAHIVSHDLKSPLRGISALATWLSEDYKDVLDDNGKFNLQQIQEKIEGMDALINGILKYSSITNKNSKNTKVDFNTVINEIIGVIFIPDHVQIRLKNTLPILNADKTKIHQLFQNLISNAVIHIEQEKGLVEISAEEQKDYWKFSVSDNGIGIPKAYHEKIFKIFQSIGKGERSTGIGLSIVKKIVDLYKGKIWLESEEGKGTTFYFTLKK